MGTKANLVIARPVVYTGPVATALPTITGTLGGSITTTGFTDVGFLGEGTKVVIEFMAERRKFRPMNKLAPIGAQNISKGAKITIQCAESDLSKWELALASAAEASDVLQDNDDGAIAFLQLLIVTPAKVFRFRMVAPDENAKTELDDTTEEMVEIVLEAYEYEAGTDGERIWEIHTRTAA